MARTPKYSKQDCKQALLKVKEWAGEETKITTLVYKEGRKMVEGQLPCYGYIKNHYGFNELKKEVGLAEVTRGDCLANKDTDGSTVQDMWERMTRENFYKLLCMDCPKEQDSCGTDVEHCYEEAEKLDYFELLDRDALRRAF